MKTKLFLLTIGFVFVTASSIYAAALNDRPVSFGSGYPGEASMQDVLDTVLGVGTLDAVNDQNAAAIWTESEANVSSYKLISITSVEGLFGVYSFSDPAKWSYLTFEDGEASFGIDVDGKLKGSGIATSVEDFGSNFGFFWETNRKIYTEDSKNGDEARSLSYLVPHLTEVDLTDDNLETLTQTPYYGNNFNFVGGWNDKITAKSDNDWILGFEDGSDFDYQDAVFYVEDMDPVPEPATILLFGAGLLGLAAYGRKKGFRRS
jgi:hypothetical protein